MTTDDQYTSALSPDQFAALVEAVTAEVKRVLAEAAYVGADDPHLLYTTADEPTLLKVVTHNLRLDESAGARFLRPSDLPGLRALTEAEAEEDDEL